MNAQDSPKDVVIKLFVATDQKNWEEVESLFYKEVNLDYSSMNGNPATILKPSEIVAAWKTLLPGFQFTHHQIGNVLEKTNKNSAKVFCYGTASHYLEDEKGNIWVVIGSYDFELKKNDQNQWQVSSMKFNFKFQEGNTSLPQKAIEIVKNQK
ncbi:nuclear transport factor 2 family protein [Aureivirga sp. CE67]|uniref:nuclear transport factor 2 family protein n=1 Tax=Aureivirga sp. CE67 TaxID=1788983 RepID=UPI0018CAC395|nr:nuclear transport factor 2 family protein [Aureivirga sp. CE67]